MQLLRHWASEKYAWKIWLIPFILISPAIFIIPPDVFTRYPWVSLYTEFMASIVPMIDRTAHLHPQPDKFRAFYAYAWAWLPLFALLSHIEYKVRREIGFKIKPPYLFKTIALTLISAWGIYLLFFAPGDRGFTFALMTRSDPRARWFSNDYLVSASAPVVTYAIFILIFGVREFFLLTMQVMKTDSSKFDKSNNRS